MYQKVRIFMLETHRVSNVTPKHAFVFFPRPNDLQFNIVITKCVTSKVRFPRVTNVPYSHAIFEPFNGRGWTRRDEEEIYLLQRN